MRFKRYEYKIVLAKHRYKNIDELINKCTQQKSTLPLTELSKGN